MAQDTHLGFPAHTLPYRCEKLSTLSTASKGRPSGRPFILGLLTDLVEFQGHSALAMSSRVLVQNALGNSLIDLLDCDLVSAIGLGAIAFCGSRLELLDGGLQFGLRSLVARIANLTDQNTLLGRLNIRQTKHLLMAFLGAASDFPPCRMIF